MNPSIRLPNTGVCDPTTWAALIEFDRVKRGVMTQADKVSRTRQLTALSRMTLAQGAEDFERLTFHDLRHTAASLAIQGGANVKQVQNMLGHEDVTVTMNTYAWLFPWAIDDLGGRMSEASEQSRVQHLCSEADPMSACVVVLAVENRRN